MDQNEINVDEAMTPLAHLHNAVDDFDFKLNQADFKGEPDNDLDRDEYSYMYDYTRSTKQILPLKKIEKLEEQCKTKFSSILNHTQLSQCKKLGSWKKRANHLINDLHKMRRTCH